MRMRWIALVIAAGGIVVAGCSKQETKTALEPSPHEAQVADGEQKELHLAVACGVAGPYGEIKEQFEHENPAVALHQELGNVVVMARQLEDDKLDADLFMSVGNVTMEKLEKEGLLLEPPMDFAEDRLVVLVREGNPLGIETFEDIANRDVETVAIAKSKSAPGHFAEMAIKRAGLYEKLEGRFVRPDQPAMLKGFVTEGKADLAVMLLTCATKEAKMGEEPAEGVPNAEIALEVAHKYYDRLPCQIGIMKDASDPELARQFATFLKTRHSQQVLADWDFFPCGDDDVEGADTITEGDAGGAASAARPLGG